MIYAFNHDIENNPSENSERFSKYITSIKNISRKRVKFKAQTQKK